jgi:putative nucleotidyltransferase with HDIG domain
MNHGKPVRADHYIDRLKELPPAPTVATELLDLFGDPDTNIVRVVDTIKHDPSLTAKLLKLCNSAYFPGAEPVTEMFEVVTRLGFYEVYCVVAALVAASVMALGKAKKGLDINRLWQHSVCSAVAAGKLAKRVGEPEAVAFTAGLLHDIGKLIFASVEGSKYGDLVKMVQLSGATLSEAEVAVLGVDHASVGEQLLVRWGLPEGISTAVGRHNMTYLKGAQLDRLTAIVQIASELAIQLENGASATPILPPGCTEALKLLRLASGDVPALVAEIKEGLQRVEGLSSTNFDAGI